MFIKLTSLNGSRLRISTEKIVGYEPYEDDDGTINSKVDAVTSTYYVKETCEQIDMLFSEGYIFVKEIK